MECSVFRNKAARILLTVVCIEKPDAERPVSPLSDDLDSSVPASAL